MTNKQTIAVGIVVFLVLGAFVALKGGSWGSKGMRNVEILQTQRTTLVISESNVAYFPGARGYFVRPQKEGTYPGIVMIHENRGLRPEIRTMADELAKEGYAVLAVDLLGEVVETQDQARVLTAKFDQKVGIENLRAAARYLREKGATKVASIGWCFGGGQSLALALSGEPLDATVIYYGRLATTTKALAPIRWPVLGVFAGNDQSISVESVEQFRASLGKLNIANEIYVYPGVGHAFANPSGMNYAPNETKDAWAKTTAFLKEHLQK